MHPLLTVVRMGGYQVPIGSYGALLCVAVAVVGFGALRTARRLELDLGACIAALGVTAAGAFFGGWLLHALVQCVRLGSLALGFARPGLAIFGALLGGGLALLAAGRGLGLAVLALADRAVPWLALGQAVGRIGCLLGGCCFGRPWSSPFALHYQDPLAPAAVSVVARHPWPLYEAAGLLLLAAALAAKPPRDAGSGRRLLSYAACYSLLRLGLEPLRGDAVRGVFANGALSTAQGLALAVLLACAALYKPLRRSELAPR
jgi:phosphatidylglycerol:prolipoprotein diacylglycerol transferase